MAPESYRCQWRLGSPFLNKKRWRLLRDIEVEEEVTEYLSAIDKLAPYLDAMARLAKTKLPEVMDLPDKPDSLVWLDKVDAWGFMEEGTYLDQPSVFMEDLEAGKRARNKYYKKKAEEQKVVQEAAAAFATAPPPQPLVG